MIEKETVEKFRSMVAEAQNIVIVGHLNPDGDCIGSTTGMAKFLRGVYKKSVTIATPTAPPDFLQFLDDNRIVMVYSTQSQEIKKKIKEADLIICMDFNAMKRLEGLGDTVAQSPVRKIMIDHHPFPEKCVDLTISTTEVSSASELTYWLLKGLGGELPTEVCESLYVGMMTDTNNFANSVYPSTFIMASELTARGIDREKLQFAVMNNYSVDRMRLIGEMLLNKMTVYPELKAAFMLVDNETKRKFSYKEGDTEGLVNMPLSIKGIEISGMFTETADYVKVSLRSRSDFSVNRFSKHYFNGGGHERAAGGRLYMPANEVQAYFEKSLREELTRGNI